MEGDLDVVQDYLHDDKDYVFSIKFEVIINSSHEDNILSGR